MQPKQSKRSRKSKSAPEPITAPEARAHIQHVEKVFAAGTDADRTDALAGQLLTFGHRALLVWNEMLRAAPDEKKSFFSGICDKAASMYGAWMKGRNLTRRPDEAERRALAGHMLLKQSSNSERLALNHFAVQAILSLPDGHPLRDTDLTRKCVLEELAWLRIQRESPRWGTLANTLSVAYCEQYGMQEEMLSWEALAAEAAPHLEVIVALRMWSAVMGYYIDLAGADQANKDRWMAEARRIRTIINVLPMTPDMRAESCLSEALLYIDTDQRHVAELYKQALDTGTVAPDVARMIATKEARVRMCHGELPRVIELLGPRLEEYEDDYSTAITDEDRTEAGEQNGEATALLAFAFAKQSRWTEAVEVIERGKCLRERHTLSLRETPEAASLLEIEGELYAISRGLASQGTSGAVKKVQDWFERDLSPQALLREKYRKLLPRLVEQLPRTMSVVQIAAGLREGEAALTLCLWWTGLIAAVVVKDHAEPIWTHLREDITQAAVMAVLVGEEGQEEGFLLALERGLAEADPRPALDRMLTYFDAVIGEPVAAVLRKRGLKRLVVLPHNVLRLVPLWALESWREFDVRIAPGAFALYHRRKPVVRSQALIVGNPTMDLPLATTEATLAAQHLSAKGLKTRVIVGVDATEGALAAALQESSLLHFAGHGIASLTNGSMSALLTSPVWKDTPFTDERELLALASRGKEVPLLTVDREPGSAHRKFFYEYAKEGTLYLEAEGDDVLVAGELWRAGDILVKGTLKNCALAFLCACSSGQGAIDSLEETSGLPSALAIAGVGCVISTGWPIADEITVLFADEFYARALRGDGGNVDVVAAVRGAAATLQAMHRQEAVRRVEALACKAVDRLAAFRLKVFAKRLAKGAEMPFSHSFDTGAFYVTGAAEVVFEA